MAEELETEPHVKISKTQSVSRALEVLRSASFKTSKRKRNEKPDDTSKILSHCHNSLISKRESNAAMGFSENHAITEMRSCLVRGDWIGLQELFPLLLTCYGDIEPIVWRYAVMLLLCSPESDSSYLREFFELCIGAQDVEENYLLDRLLTLRDKSR